MASSLRVTVSFGVVVMLSFPFGCLPNLIAKKFTPRCALRQASTAMTPAQFVRWVRVVPKSNGALVERTAWLRRMLF
jgi:hypothetical protein